MIWDMRKSRWLRVVALFASLLVVPQSASAGGGCTSEEPYFSNSVPKSGDTFEAVAKYWINDMAENWYLDPEYAPVFYIDDEVPELIVKTKFVEVDSKNLAVFKATVKIPLSIQGNRRFTSIVYNICGAEIYERYGGREGPTLVIWNDQQSKDSCYLGDLDINPRKVNVNQELKVTFLLNFTGTVGEPFVEARYLDQIIKVQATKLQEIGLTRQYEATLKFEKPVRYNQMVFVKALVPKLCSGLGQREVVFTKTMIGNQEDYTSEVIEHGKVTLLGVAGICSKLNEKTMVFETSTKSIELTCSNYTGKVLTWVTPEILASIEAEIAELKKKPCKFGSGMTNNLGRFVCGPRDGAFYYMSEEEFKVAVVKAQEEANAKAKAESDAKIKAEADVKIKVEADAKVAAKKKVTITCVKGKLTKKVTAVSPKCPSGYKNK
jgi:hypothetical protein